MAKKQADIIAASAEHSMKVLRGIENDDIEGLVDGFKAAQAEIDGRLQGAFSEMTASGWNMADMANGGRDQKLFDEISRILGDLNVKTNDQITNAAAKQFENALAHASYAIDQATPPTIPAKVPVIPMDNVKALVNTPYEGAMFSQRIGMVSDAMAMDIRNGLLQSMIQGEDMRSASKRVADVLGSASRTDPRSHMARAEAIARTEIMRSQNLGRDASYRANEDVLEKEDEWVATADGRLCPWCLRRDGMTTAEIAKAPSGKDPFGKKNKPPLHTHCRCTLAPQVKTWKDLIGMDMPEQYDDTDRAMRDDEGKWKFVDKESYDDWKKRRGADLGVTVN